MLSIVLASEAMQNVREFTERFKCTAEYCKDLFYNGAGMRERREGRRQRKEKQEKGKIQCLRQVMRTSPVSQGPLWKQMAVGQATVFKARGK